MNNKGKANYYIVPILDVLLVYFAIVWLFNLLEFLTTIISVNTISLLNQFGLI